MTERDPATAPSSMSRRSMAKARSANQRTEGLVVFLVLTLGIALTFVVGAFYLVRRPFAVLLLALAAACNTVQVTISSEEGHGSSRVKGAQDVSAVTSSNSNSNTNVKAEAPVSLIPK